MFYPESAMRSPILDQHITAMKKHHILAALLALSPFAASASEPVTEALSYRAYIGGVPLGTLNLKIAMDEASYATEARFDIATLFKWALDTDAQASSSGWLSEGSPVPA